VVGGKNLFVGIGIQHYEAPGLVELTHAVADVESVRGLLGAAFEGEPLLDPSENDARARLQALDGSLPKGGSLLVLWSGHGLKSGEDVKLLCADSPRSPARGLDARAVVEPCAMSGAGQILFIVDTCFSGGVVADATQVAAKLLETYPPAVDHVWVGVLASCSSAVTALDGRLGALLRRLLTPGQGPA
jgi:hypothetical protein